ncbi:MAG: ribonuclease III [Myxococcota bacterium]
MPESTSETPPPPEDPDLALCGRLGLDPPPARLSEALTHPSWANENPGEPDNQRLEFLGDSVLGLCVSEMLMAAFSDVDEGGLTVMRAALVNATALSSAAARLDIAPALRLGRGAEAAGERHRPNVLADATEAIIGAVYLEGGMPAARPLSRRVVGEDFDRLVARGGIERDAKSRLQERLQADGLAPPGYVVVDEHGPPHARTFSVEATLPGGTRHRGEGRSKKAAEQAAARVALQHLEPRDDGSRG